MTLMLSVDNGILECENSICENKTNCRHLRAAVLSPTILKKLKQNDRPVSITNINKILDESDV